jgi:hypothetical protein
MRRDAQAATVRANRGLCLIYRDMLRRIALWLHSARQITHARSQTNRRPRYFDLRK